MISDCQRAFLFSPPLIIEHYLTITITITITSGRETFSWGEVRLHVLAGSWSSFFAVFLFWPLRVKLRIVCDIIYIWKEIQTSDLPKSPTGRTEGRQQKVNCIVMFLTFIESFVEVE